MASDDKPGLKTSADADRCVRVLTLEMAATIIDWSPDGDRLAVGSYLGGIEIVTVEGQRLWRAEHQDRVADVAWSPTGDHLASGSIDETVRIWDAQNGAARGIFRASSMVTSVSWAPDSRRVACASNEIIIFDTKMGTKISGWFVVGGPYCVGWSPDGGQLVVGCRSGDLRLRDESGSNVIDQLRGHKQIIRRLAWTHDNRYLASVSDDRKIRIWNVAERRCIYVLSGCDTLAWSPDGTLLVSGSIDTGVQIWSSKNGEEVAHLGGSAGSSRTVAFSPDGCYLASNKGNTVRIWDVSDLYQVRSGRDIPVTVYDYAGRQAATVGRLPRWASPSLWVSRPSQRRRGKGQTSAPRTFSRKFKGPSPFHGSVDISQDSRFLVIGGGFGALKKVHFRTKGPAWQSINRHQINVEDVNISPCGKLVASADFFGVTKITDMFTGASVSVFSEHRDAIFNVTWSPDSKLVATVSPGEPSIPIWDAKTGAVVRRCRVRDKDIRYLDWSPDGEHLALGSGPVDILPSTGGSTSLKSKSVKSSGTVRILRSTDGVELSRHNLHQRNVTCVCWFPRGRILASTSSDGEIVIWDAHTQEEKIHWQGHTGRITCIVWSPNGRFLASAARDEDKTIRLWDSKTGREAHRFTFKESFVSPTPSPHRHQQRTNPICSLGTSSHSLTLLFT